MTQGSESYEWLLNSCLQECRRSITRLEQIASTAEQKKGWLQEDLDELLSLESAAIESMDSLRRTSGLPDSSQDITQERLDKLQTKLLQCFHHLASEGISTSSCV